MKMKYIRQSRSMQRGAALAIGLVLLAVASMVTITSLNTGVMQERMAANQDNHARSFMAAEAGGARLVEWFNTNGWPTATSFPPASGAVNDPSVTYTITRRGNPPPAWTTSPLIFEVVGRALAPDGSTVLAQTRLLVELERTRGGGPPAALAPAAISCFGGPCSITAGAGGGVPEDFGVVSGFNHPIPPLGCSGARCRREPQDEDRITPDVPAVFLTHRSGSSVQAQGGSDKKTPDNNDTSLPFQGLNPSGSGVIRGTGIAVALSPPPSTTPPAFESVFLGGVAPTQTVLESGRSTMNDIGGSDFEVGILVLNGQNLTFRGTSLFVGLIVIRNCGTLNMGGSSNIYGAIIVDATQPDPRNPNGPRISCDRNYDPFSGNGRPAVRYSLDALNRAANPPPPSGTGAGFGVVRWMEIIQ